MGRERASSAAARVALVGLAIAILLGGFPDLSVAGMGSAERPGRAPAPRVSAGAGDALDEQARSPGRLREVRPEPQRHVALPLLVLVVLVAVGFAVAGGVQARLLPSSAWRPPLAGGATRVPRGPPAPSSI